MNILFTADTHWRHRNILRYCNRPYATIGEHDEALISNWNSVVNPGDTVYHLGDVCLGDDLDKILNRLNGNIHWIHGNHDKQAWRLRHRFASHAPLREIRVTLRDGRKQDIVLCHYAMRVWNKSHHGAWHLYGHSHGGLETVPYGKSMDVGVDSCNYTPISLDEVTRILDKRQVAVIDHHK